VPWFNLLLQPLLKLIAKIKLGAVFLASLSLPSAVAKPKVAYFSASATATEKSAVTCLLKGYVKLGDLYSIPLGLAKLVENANSDVKSENKELSSVSTLDSNAFIGGDL